MTHHTSCPGSRRLSRACQASPWSWRSSWPSRPALRQHSISMQKNGVEINGEHQNTTSARQQTQITLRNQPIARTPKSRTADNAFGHDSSKCSGLHCKAISRSQTAKIGDEPATNDHAQGFQHAIRLATRHWDPLHPGNVTFHPYRFKSARTGAHRRRKKEQSNRQSCRTEDAHPIHDHPAASWSHEKNPPTTLRAGTEALAKTDEAFILPDATTTQKVPPDRTNSIRISMHPKYTLSDRLINSNCVASELPTAASGSGFFTSGRVT